MEHFSLQYIAGFWVGEGTVGTHPRSKGFINITQADEALLDAIAASWGSGSVTVKNKQQKNRVYAWSLYTAQARQLVHAISAHVPPGYKRNQLIKHFGEEALQPYEGVDLDWCAGFFDGEGYIGYVNQKGSKSPRLELSVGQKYREPLDAFCSVLGGNVRPRGNHFKVSWSRRKAQEIYDLLLPRVHVKFEPRRQELQDAYLATL